MNLLCNYQGYRGCTLILVFDAYKVPQGLGSVEKYHNIHIVYTRQAETADQYIERLSFELRGRRRVRVATSDNLEQLHHPRPRGRAHLRPAFPRRGLRRPRRRSTAS
ncbi:MAG: NYN domain-containing protein [Oscillospiraceae bacterium]